jgi:hypothetical protein
VIDLGKTRHVRLVCVVNGLAESRERYLMHGSVSSITAWGADPADSEQRTLQRLPAEQMQTLQDAAGDLGETSTVHLRVDAVAAGETVITYDPDDCYIDPSVPSMDLLADGEKPQHLDPDGCIRAAAPYAGIAEVVVYVKD